MRYSLWTYCVKKVSIHQVTTMLATSKNILFAGHNHVLPTGANELALAVARAIINHRSSVPVNSSWLSLIKKYHCIPWVGLYNGTIVPSCYTMVYHNMVPFYGTLWYTVPWYTVVYYGIYVIQMYHGILWYTMYGKL